MDAGTLNCPSCGAAAPADATECRFCHAKLATIGCPSCFGLVFMGAKFCDHCGARIEAAVQQNAPARRCPRGCGSMERVTLGDVPMDECPKCNGLWLDPATFERLCTQKEQPAVALFAGGMALVSDHPVDQVRYVPCPECGKLMNRMNFAHASGIIIDTCKAHGVWFDADELRRVIEFIRGGGLDAARHHEIEQLAAERKLREFEQGLDREQSIVERHTGANEGLAPGAAMLSVFLSLKL